MKRAEPMLRSDDPWPGQPSSRFVRKDLGDGPPDLLVNPSDFRHRARRRVVKSAWADG